MLSFLESNFYCVGGEEDQHDDSLGPCASIHLIGTLFSLRYGMRRLIDGKFRTFAAKLGGFIST